ncbi:Coenzyme F420 hydrogenase/dehydrogenase, beta subunit C-terminal domain [Naasia sp. SYSU D00948]|uniref:Coenzyme F420 hydrogenase/dehydrogenase, beta subunit C-terminal domain n=1 Tax=Naasia sp. SYSU D00948 TaxID=2817379 RepID=UPI001B3007A1|nr:Coenzyme F420 hydrogenase/dehydrogenase, beta subunit C-terminal domain [Naasia sp. SYSU D00948]
MPFTIEEVVAGGTCVGCGACSVATGGRIPVTIGRYGAPQARLDGVPAAARAVGSRVCPFSDDSPNEDVLADARFGQLPHDGRVGRFRAGYAARVTDEEFLLGSSSGGLTGWVTARLLERGEVDGVIHVGRSSEEGGALFEYQVSSTPAEVVAKRKSRYYATSFAEALASIRGREGRFAFVGVPCFVRAARAVAAQDPELNRRLAFYLGLVCGHLKTPGFAEALAWQLGVPPGELDEVDFRVKNPTRSASRYDFGARAQGASEMVTAATADLLGGSWGHGMFQLNACNYCDDIFAETADAVFGDAWLPRYVADYRGTNLVITRSPLIDAIIEDGLESGAIVGEALSVDDAAASQAANFRHRRDGLRVRLADDLRAGLPVPRKRVEPGYEGVPTQRLPLIRQRRAMSPISERALEEAKRSGRLGRFLRIMRREVMTYQRLEGKSLRTRLATFVRHTSVGRGLGV